MRIVTAHAQAPPQGAQETRSIRLDSGQGLTRPPSDFDDRRDWLERDLDRVQMSLDSERKAFGQVLSWQLLSQVLLLNAYFAVLIFGWSTPLPGKRWLLAGVAVFGFLVAVLLMLTLRATREAIISLHQQRKILEAGLQRDFGRTPRFVPRSLATNHLASLANGVLPMVFVAGWFGLTVYTLAAPLPTQEAHVSSGPPAVLSADQPDAQTPSLAASAEPVSSVAAFPGSARKRAASPVTHRAGFDW